MIIKSVVAASVAALLYSHGVASAPNDAPISSLEDDPTIVDQIAGKCAAVDGMARIKVKVVGLGSEEGNLRVQAYSDNPDEFLEKGFKVMRLDIPASDDRDICVPMPRAGKYAIVLLHDRNANGSADIFTEGFGFSRNPSLGLSKPDHADVVTHIPEGVTSLKIELKYVFGDLGENSEKRRRNRRR